MEIDLELPSGEQDRLEAVSNINSDAVDPVDGICVEEDESSKVGNVCENDICCEDGVNLNNFHGATANEGAANFEPRVGLEFCSKEAAYSFYREYARSVGFGITIKASRRSKKSGKFIDVKVACSRFGGKRESSTTVNSRSCPKTDCKASMHMKKSQEGKWFIYSFIKEHNHDLCPEDFYSSIRGKNKQSGLLPSPVEGLQLALDVGDVKVLFDYFMYMQDTNPNFLYAIDLDHEKRMRNVFWVDAKGRHDYSYFNDVILFDTTYADSKHRIPLVPIVGVNNHFQFMLVGCALIGDKTASNFAWLMRTWLKVVRGQAPRIIITDQDKFLKEAVDQVFPEARHCFCLWHVLRKVPEHLGHVINQYEHFMMRFNECIYQSWTYEQFEKRWWEMVDDFELRDDEWIQMLYEDRKKWVPHYMEKIFLAGLSTVERVGSIASFFDKYVQKETSLKDFIENYKAYLRDRDDEEAEADSETRHKQPNLKFSSPFLKQMSMTYTYAIFEKFQAEALGINTCNLHEKCENGVIITYQVDDLEQRQNFVVVWNESGLDIFCSCHSFEYRGILCRHAMAVLCKSGVSTIPSRYILRRWTNHARVRQNDNYIPNVSCRDRVQRFNDLYKLAIKLGEEGSLSKETYIIAIHALETALKHFGGIKSASKPGVFSAHGFHGIEEDIHDRSLPRVSKKTYRKRKRCHEVELAAIGMLESPGQHVERLHAGTQDLEGSNIHQQNMQEMEISCNSGYYGDQPSVQGVGQLDSLSLIHDGYFGNQHVMQGLGQLNPEVMRGVHYDNPQSVQGLGQLSFGATTLSNCFDISLHDMEHSMGSAQFRGISSSKQLHDKHTSR